jgi:hypothetical protein
LRDLTFIEEELSARRCARHQARPGLWLSKQSKIASMVLWFHSPQAYLQGGTCRHAGRTPRRVLQQQNVPGVWQAAQEFTQWAQLCVHEQSVWLEGTQRCRRSHEYQIQVSWGNGSPSRRWGFYGCPHRFEVHASCWCSSFG